MIRPGSLRGEGGNDMNPVTGTKHDAQAEAGKGITRALARHAATLQYEALPVTLVDVVKQCVLDTIGVAIGTGCVSNCATLEPGWPAPIKPIRQETRPWLRPDRRRPSWGR